MLWIPLSLLCSPRPWGSRVLGCSLTPTPPSPLPLPFTPIINYLLPYYKAKSNTSPPLPWLISVPSLPLLQHPGGSQFQVRRELPVGLSRVWCWAGLLKEVLFLPVTLVSSCLSS